MGGGRFLGNNAGLIVAEIELTHEAEAFDLPHWVAEEVTDDAKYYNNNLTMVAYNRWG